MSSPARKASLWLERVQQTQPNVQYKARYPNHTNLQSTLRFEQVLYPTQNVASDPNIRHREAPRKPPPQARGTASSSTSTRTPQGQPKPPRSAFICFTDAKKKEIMSTNGILEVRCCNSDWWCFSFFSLQCIDANLMLDRTTMTC